MRNEFTEKMWGVLLLTMTAVMLCFAVVANASPETDATVKAYAIGGGHCSGVIVSANGLMLTAKHCGADREVYCEVRGKEKRVKATLLACDPAFEGATVYDLEGDGFAFCSIAADPPKIGDKVHTLGFPHDEPMMQTHGRIKANGLIFNKQKQTASVYTADFGSVAPGWSGGPLFNESGEVVGLLNGHNPLIDDQGNTIRPANESYWITHESITSTLAKALQSPGEAPLVVVFTVPGCAPCARLKADINAGRFPGYEFKIVEYNSALGVFSDPELHSQFVEECHIAKDVLAPTIWVPTTGKYKEGYSTGSALVDFLEGLAGFIVRGPGRPKVPGPSGGLQPIADPVIGQPLPTLSGALADMQKQIAEIKTETQKLVTDVLAFKDAGLIGRTAMIPQLRRDFDSLKENIATVKNAAEDIQANPWSMLSMIGGAISGLFHKRLFA